MNIVIVGSGLAGTTVAQTLAADGRFQVVPITKETQGYCAKPRLSHGISLTDEATRGLVLKRFDALQPSILVLPKVDAIAINRQRRVVSLSDGREVPYDRLVLATGSAARVPVELDVLRSGFFTLNSYEDLLALRACAQKVRAANGRVRWAVIGGGLIGCELASDMNKAGDSVTIFHRAARLMELQFSDAQSVALQAHFEAHGVEVLLHQGLNALPAGYDAVVVCTGFAPRVQLARDAGLNVDRGIVVDARLCTQDPCIYAAGDVAQIGGRLFPFVIPIRSQALWLAKHLAESSTEPWTAPDFTPGIKIHGFKAERAGADFLNTAMSANSV